MHESLMLVFSMSTKYSSAFLRIYTYTDSKRVVSQDFKASTLLICIVDPGVLQN